jgi:hypothetical protein
VTTTEDVTAGAAGDVGEVDGADADVEDSYSI